MFDLHGIKKINDREIARQRDQPRFPDYGFTGNERQGVYLRRAQTLLTFYIQPGEPARDFLQGIAQLKSETARSRYVSSYFPFAT